jgi:hypothetical protein
MAEMLKEALGIDVSARNLKFALQFARNASLMTGREMWGHQ